MNKIIDKIVDFHGILSDKDFIWWPFSFLRPEKDQEITMKTKITMTLCFGGASSLMLMVVAIMNNAFDLKSQLQTFVILLAAFFAWFNIITAPLWNARARRLQNRK
jgi:hypothetical protein